MRFASFLTPDGASYGTASGTGLRPVASVFRARYPTLRHAIAGNALAAAAEATAGSEELPFDGADFLPLIQNPDKIICVGKNYAAHAADSGDQPTEFPSLFIRLSNTLVGHGHVLVRPRVSQSFDYEGELAFVIGRAGRHIAEADALSHVAGYACFNDASVRDYQFRHSLAAGKNFVSTGGFGPVLVTPDEVGDPAALTVITRVNGVERQRGSTEQLIFSIPYIIAYVSAFTPLLPGDVIATGTPRGAGYARRPALWLAPGDRIEVEIPGVGVLANSVVAETN